MSDVYSGVGSDYDLVPVEHDPFADVGASMAQHLTGNPAADPEHFLDWDKPLSEQSPKVQNALINAGADPGIQSFHGEQLYRRLGEALQGNAKAQFSADRQPSHILATDYLRQAGIPGIKYLDQGSRGSGAGTHNYVVFDDKLIDIIKKYGIAGLIAGGAAHFSTQPVDHDPYASGMARGGAIGRKARVKAILQRHGIAA